MRLTNFNFKSGPSTGASVIFEPGKLRTFVKQVDKCYELDYKAKPNFVQLTNKDLEQILRVFGNLPACGGDAGAFCASLQGDPDELIELRDPLLGKVCKGDVFAFLELQYFHARSKYWAPNRIGSKANGMHPDNKHLNWSVPIPLSGWRLVQGISYERWRSNCDPDNIESVFFLDLLLGHNLASTRGLEDGTIAFGNKLNVARVSKEVLEEKTKGFTNKVLATYRNYVYGQSSKRNYWYRPKMITSDVLVELNPTFCEFYNDCDYPVRNMLLKGCCWADISKGPEQIGSLSDWDKLPGDVKTALDETSVSDSRLGSMFSRLQS